MQVNLAADTRRGPPKNFRGRPGVPQCRGPSVFPPLGASCARVSDVPSRFVRPLLQGCLLASFALVAQAQIKVGVVTSSTGPVALVGLPQKKSVPLLPTKVAGQTVQYISLDDGSDPTAAVSAFKKLINEDKVDAIIGPSGSPAAMGVIQFAAAAGVPMLAPVGTAAVVLPMNDRRSGSSRPRRTTTSSPGPGAAHGQTKVKTVGFIGTADPYGENW
jgi:branched-chain amino acid transport system substrate-binding protein